MAIVSTMILRSMRMIGEKPRGATLDTNEQTETLAEFPELWRVSLKCVTVRDLTLESALARALRVARASRALGEAGGLLAAIKELDK